MAPQALQTAFTSFQPLNSFVSSRASAIVTADGASPLFLCLLRVFSQGLKRCQARPRLSRTPLVSVPSRRLAVNEWAGHLTPRGSTSGSSDHQLACLEPSHAPDNPCSALTCPHVSLSTLLIPDLKHLECLLNSAQK